MFLLWIQEEEEVDRFGRMRSHHFVSCWSFPSDVSLFDVETHSQTAVNDLTRCEGTFVGLQHECTSTPSLDVTVTAIFTVTLL